MKPLTKQTVKTASKFVTIGLLVGLLIGAFIAYGQSPSSTFTISSGVYPGAPSYTVWTEGSEYFAKDANGLLAYSGTNASQIIQNSLDNGISIYIKAGTYEDVSIIINSKNQLFGDGRDTILDGKSSANVITTVGGGSISSGVRIQDLMIQYAGLDGLHLEDTQRLVVDHVYIINSTRYGIYLKVSYLDEFRNVEVDQNGQGDVGLLIDDSNVNSFYTFLVFDCLIAGTKITGTSWGNAFYSSDWENNYDYGVWIEQGSTNQFYACCFEAEAARTLIANIRIDDTNSTVENSGNAFIGGHIAVTATYGIILSRVALDTIIQFSEIASFTTYDLYINGSSVARTKILANVFTATPKVSDTGTNTTFWLNTHYP